MLGDDGTPSPGENMMSSSSSLKDAVILQGSSDWIVELRYVYQIGKSAQIIKEMQREPVMLGIIETHWNQSGEQHLFSGESFKCSGYDDKATI